MKNFQKIILSVATSLLFTVAAQAQVKIGSNPTTITSGANLEVEGTGGVKTVILTNGNLGVGTAAPTAVLDVNGAARIRTVAAGSAADKVLVVDANGNVKQNVLSLMSIPTTPANVSTVSGQWNKANNGVNYVQHSAIFSFTLPVAAEVIISGTTNGGGVCLGCTDDNGNGNPDVAFNGAAYFSLRVGGSNTIAYNSPVAYCSVSRNASGRRATSMPLMGMSTGALPAGIYYIDLNWTGIGGAAPWTFSNASSTMVWAPESMNIQVFAKPQ
jgi:hypothetical protein